MSRPPGDGPARPERSVRERVFGEVLPATTTDESDRGWGERPEGDGDDWLRRQVPPHHG